MPDDAVPTPPAGRRLRARDGILVVLLAAILLVLFEGSSIRHSGEEMQPGFERDVVLAVGKPAGWVADRLPFDEAGDRALAWLEDDEASDTPGFERAAANGGIPPVTPESFDPQVLGAEPEPPRALDTLLITGDSLAMPLDAELARRLAGDVRVERDPHVGTGISKTGLLDWGRLATRQVRQVEPDAVVVFVGANEGFAIGETECCGPEWAAQYAYRVRRMIDTYRQGGAVRVYWLTLPAPRDADRQRIAAAVNAAIAVGAEAYRAHARVLDMSELFTPGGEYRDAMTVGDRRQIVREADGIHLNAAGARVAADAVLDAVRRDYG